MRDRYAGNHEPGCQRRAKIAQFWRLKFAHLVMSQWPVDLVRRVRLTVSVVSVSGCSVR